MKKLNIQLSDTKVGKPVNKPMPVSDSEVKTNEINTIHCIMMQASVSCNNVSC